MSKFLLLFNFAMLQRSPESKINNFIKVGAKTLLVIEGILFISSYGLWYRMNTSRDFRLYMNNNFYWILDSYYKLGETFSSKNETRKLDFAIWRKEGKIN